MKNPHTILIEQHFHVKREILSEYHNWTIDSLHDHQGVKSIFLGVHKPCGIDVTKNDEGYGCANCDVRITPEEQKVLENTIDFLIGTVRIPNPTFTTELKDGTIMSLSQSTYPILRRETKTI